MVHRLATSQLGSLGVPHSTITVLDTDFTIFYKYRSDGGSRSSFMGEP